MTTWAQIEVDLAALLAELLGIPCDWRGKSRGMHITARAQIDSLTDNAIGVDEPVWADVPALPASPTAVQATVHGLGEFTLQVLVESWQQSLAESARAYLKLLRSRLRLPSTLVRLAAMGLALVTIERSVPLDPQSDGRVTSSASMDLRLAYGTSEVDAAIPYIETARVHSTELGLDETLELT